MLIYDLNAELKELNIFVSNKETHLLRFFEPNPGLFIAETLNVIEIALRKGYQPYAVVCTEKILCHPVIQLFTDIPVYIVNEDKACKRFGYVLTGGISCAFYRKKPSDYRDVLRDAKRIVVLEKVVNPTNLGAIIRSAAALQMDGVLLSPGCVNPLYRRALRVSVGNALQIPWAYVGKHEEEWQKDGVNLLRAEGFQTVAMALRKDAIGIDDWLLKKVDKLALILGNEGNGLYDTTIEQADYVAVIPMKSGVDSLNVAVAAGLAIWEISK